MTSNECVTSYSYVVITVSLVQWAMVSVGRLPLNDLTAMETACWYENEIYMYSASLFLDVENEGCGLCLPLWQRVRSTQNITKISIRRNVN